MNMAKNYLFPPLTEDDVEARVSVISEKGCSLLLYKDARVDQNMLDNTVGPLNWQKCYSRDNANCCISIWDGEKKQWISKEDTGKESVAEKEKGLASDSFKRAGFAWGIGRELYTAPFIWFNATEVNIYKNSKGKLATNDRFEVTELTVSDDRKILSVTVKNLSSNVEKTFRNRTAKKSASEEDKKTGKKTPSYSVNEEAAKENNPAKEKKPESKTAVSDVSEPAAKHTLQYKCGRQGQTLEEIYDNGSGEKYLKNFLRLADKDPRKKEDAEAIQKFFKEIGVSAA